jgi:lysophospholipase L1-like esterase
MKITACGDSITQGLGVKELSYGNIVSEQLQQLKNIEVKFSNLAGSAMQISETMKYIPIIIESNPDLILIMHGITEAIIRPKRKIIKNIT